MVTATTDPVTMKAVRDETLADDIILYSAGHPRCR